MEGMTPEEAVERLPPLILADWLEECNQPELAKAIRTICKKVKGRIKALGGAAAMIDQRIIQIVDQAARAAVTRDAKAAIAQAVREHLASVDLGPLIRSAITDVVKAADVADQSVADLVAGKKASPEP